ncbi:MAG: hypothetical protein QXN55_01730 [Candidatus Nitrosotenuis sp.]
MKIFEVLQPYLDRHVTPYRPWMFDTYRKVQEYLQGLRLFDNSRAKINPRTLEISCHDSLFVKPNGRFDTTVKSFFIEKDGYQVLPVKWTYINMLTIPANVKLHDFAGFPDAVDRLTLEEVEFESTDDFPQVIHDEFHFYLKGYKPFNLEHVSCKEFTYGVTDKSDIPTVKGGPQDARTVFVWARSINFKDVGKFYPHVRNFSFYFSEPSGLLSFLSCPELIAVGPDPNVNKSTVIERAEAASSIIVKHLHAEKDILDCKSELIEAGYQEFAKL